MNKVALACVGTQFPKTNSRKEPGRAHPVKETSMTTKMRFLGIEFLYSVFGVPSELERPELGPGLI